MAEQKRQSHAALQHLREFARSSDRERSEEFVHFALAGGEGIEMDAGFVEHREIEIREGRWFGVAKMAAAAHAAGSAARDDDRQIGVIMNVGVAHAAAIKIERVIEERAIAIGSLLHFLEEFGEERDVELIDLRHAGDFVRIVAVMRKR